MLCISEEDKNEKGATADSVQQRRQYRRQNRQSSSGYKRFYPRSFLSHTQPLSLTKSKANLINRHQKVNTAVRSVCFTGIIHQCSRSVDMTVNQEARNGWELSC